MALPGVIWETNCMLTMSTQKWWISIGHSNRETNRLFHNSFMKVQRILPRLNFWNRRPFQLKLVAVFAKSLLKLINQAHFMHIRYVPYAVGYVKIMPCRENPRVKPTQFIWKLLQFPWRTCGFTNCAYKRLEWVFSD